MGYYDGVAIPCAYLLSDSKDKETYRSFFQLIKTKTNDRMNPEGLLVDFEEALSSAFVEVFSSCMVWHDFFHFQQANVKNLKKMGLSDYVKEVCNDTRALWNQLTKRDFDQFLGEFINRWNQVIPQYITYFRNVWINRFKPNVWARFARPEGVPSGML